MEEFSVVSVVPSEPGAPAQDRGVGAAAAGVPGVPPGRPGQVVVGEVAETPVALVVIIGLRRVRARQDQDLW